MKIHEINHPSSESIFNGDFLSENNFIFINNWTLDKKIII